MLERLFVKNIGLIDELEINFERGLNIFTGETGAGKSMILNSINFLCGKKIDKIFIRKNCDSAIIEGCFYLENDNEKNFLMQMGFDIDADNLAIISRQYSACKTTNRLNGRNITVGMLREISQQLVEFHGQNENQKLFDPHKHLEILDKFCGHEIITLKENLTAQIKKLNADKKIIADLLGQDDLENKIMLIEFQVNEISNANLVQDEEEKLRARYKILTNAKNIYEKTAQIYDLLYDGEFSARDTISRANQLAIEQPFAENLNSILINLDEMKSDVADNLATYEQILQNSAQEMLDIESRLDFIYELKLKYKKNVNEIIEYGDVLAEQLQNLKLGGEKIAQIEKNIAQTENEIYLSCKKISELRKKFAKMICQELEKTFAELSMPDAKIKIDFTQKDFDSNGFDNVKFLIATNLGEDFKPIDKISSGGEISRIMLAMETVFAKYNNISTIIFDEIDSGVSGKVAQMVAEKLSVVSKNHQLICITHLSQIAAMADTHFLIQKISANDSTNTTINKLDTRKSITELARILSGKKITETALKTASEMKNEATKFKRRKS